VAFAPQGHGGFGYDPVFFYPALKKTMGRCRGGKTSDFPPGKALRKFKEELENIMELTR
jgi:XTP/dITP diphosphohydrolase